MWVTFWTAVGAIAALAAVFAPFAIHHLQTRKRSGDGDYTVEGQKWVSDRDWSYQDLLHRLIDLDFLSLAGSSLTAEDEGTVEQWAPVFEKSPETWALVVYRKKLIVGYWSYFSISDALVDKLKAGILMDSEISESEVRSIYDPGPHNIYFAMIARHPDMTFKGDRAVRLLRNSLINSAKHWLAKVDIANVYAVCFSPEAVNLCRHFGLKQEAKMAKGLPLFVGKPDTLARHLQRYA